jgi:hypothetical protein
MSRESCTRSLPLRDSYRIIDFCFTVQNRDENWCGKLNSGCVPQQTSPRWARNHFFRSRQGDSQPSSLFTYSLATGRINFTCMLRCIVINFFLNNQPDALIIPILFCYKTLHVSDVFSAHHQEFSTVHSALVSFCLEAVIRNLHETYQCRMYSGKLLMMGREEARNMWSFVTE